MANKTDRMILLVSIILFSLLSFSVGYSMHNPNDIKLIKAYDNYNMHCELLLDSIASWEDNNFLDVTCESNEYCNYLTSREQLDSILYNKH